MNSGMKHGRIAGHRSNLNITAISFAVVQAKWTARLSALLCLFGTIVHPSVNVVAATVDGNNSVGESEITIATYYFGNYHPNDKRNMSAFGRSWSEWEVVKHAKTKFPNHQQPKVPLWGYGDESDSKVMERKIAAAADYGIGAFIFDWYYYDDGPFLQGALDQGFLRAKNNSRLRFALMWANHDWDQSVFKAEHKAFYRGQVTPETFDHAGDILIRNYFSRANYWKIDGKPYFSFYDLPKLIANFGGVQETREALDRFRSKARAANLQGIHLNLVAWQDVTFPGQSEPVNSAKLASELGFDSITSYTWVHHAQLHDPQTSYADVRDQYFEYWNRAAIGLPLPYIPNVTMGWDRSPRDSIPGGGFSNTYGKPNSYSNVVVGNTPEEFEEALRRVKGKLLQSGSSLRILTICCWNEWTEGSYLEPDVNSGMKYLEAVRNVVGRR